MSIYHDPTLVSLDSSEETQSQGRLSRSSRTDESDPLPRLHSSAGGSQEYLELTYLDIERDIMQDIGQILAVPNRKVLHLDRSPAWPALFWNSPLGRLLSGGIDVYHEHPVSIAMSQTHNVRYARH